MGNSFCSFVVGGWGGGVVGLSSVDGSDASENETSRSKEFKRGQWYRVQVEPLLFWPRNSAAGYRPLPAERCVSCGTVLTEQFAFEAARLADVSIAL